MHIITLSLSNQISPVSLNCHLKANTTIRKNMKKHEYIHNTKCTTKVFQDVQDVLGCMMSSYFQPTISQSKFPGMCLTALLTVIVVVIQQR